MQIFLVGGAVRDKLLGYPYHERDWVVVGADDSELEAQGFKRVGADFPVFLHPDTKEEYALARRERKTGRGYTGFEFYADANVTLEQDLERRDLTINAIAETPEGKIVDPFSGLRDIEERLLRHVSPAFAEDPVRVLRIARFAARYHHLGFRIAPETMTLMLTMVRNGELNHLVSERVWKEFERALGEANPEQFITSLRSCGALAIIMPELDALFGVPQPPKHHPEIDTGEHTLGALSACAQLSTDPCLRFATLTHDLGKALTKPQLWPSHHGHESAGLAPLRTLCKRLKVPKRFNELAAIVTEFHTHCHRAFELKGSTIVALLEKTDAFRRPERFEEFLVCCKADARGRLGHEQSNYPQANYLMSALRLAQSVETKPLLEKGLSGALFASALRRARVQKINTLVRAQRLSLEYADLDK